MDRFKKGIALGAASLLLFSSFPLPAFAESSETAVVQSGPTRYTVADSPLYSAPGVASGATLKKGEEVTMLEEADGYTQIRLSDDSLHYIEATMLSTEPPAVTYEQTDLLYAKQKLSVLAEAKSDAATSGEIAFGEAVAVFGTEGEYARVKVGSGYGYVPSSLLGAEPASIGQRYVQRDTELLRAGTVIGTLKTNERIAVYGSEGDWTRVKTPIGFALAKTADLGNAPLKTGARYAARKTSVTIDGQITGTLKTNDRIAIYGTEGEWTRVKSGEAYGLVLTAHLSPVPVKTGDRYVAKTTVVKKDGKTIATLKYGTKITVYGTIGTSVRIKIGTAFHLIPASALSLTKPAPYEAMGKRYVTHDDLTVRSKASLSGKKVAAFDRGRLIETYGTSGYWTRVKVKSGYAYVASSSLSLNKPKAKPKKGTIFYVQLDRTPLFATDVAYSTPKAYLKKGTKLTGLRSIDDDFWQVRLPNGTTGYVINPYISIVKPVNTKQTPVSVKKRYVVKSTTSFYARPGGAKSGLIEKDTRIYPRYKVGDYYIIQDGWSSVYLPAKHVSITSDSLLYKKADTARERLIAAAVPHLGTPYTWGSQNPLNGGFDCSGLIHYASNKAGKTGGRTNVSGYWYGGFFKAQRTTITKGKRGDLIFFANTYKKGPSHIGIMLDSTRFIHAGGTQLQINSIYEPRWQSHFLGYKSL
ncbi:SH3 domain-containing protein [Exiguobacterium flavidum]|uniref:SH3 domain-containing protein n=1 Tax=Exiguobacterium flavidum TaxID=2184695 RepID=UPI000DF7ED61|nr:NlpC/P60 family protein [Exiguobacterium flavidum]